MCKVPTPLEENAGGLTQAHDTISMFTIKTAPTNCAGDFREFVNIKEKQTRASLIFAPSSIPEGTQMLALLDISE